MATCECFVNPAGARPEELATCEQNAEARGAVIVDQCPPPGEPVATPPHCAAEGAGCTLSELTSGELTGCCIGTVCKPDGGGHSSCHAASEGELALSVACEHAVRAPFPAPVPELRTTELVTSLGTAQLRPSAITANSGIATAGCLVSFEVTYGIEKCGFSLSVDTVNGRRVVRSMVGSLSGCAGMALDPNTPNAADFAVSEPPITIAFDGFGCGSNDRALNDCLAGVFDFRLDGALSPTLSLVDQHLRFEGAACSIYDYRDVVCPG